MAWWHTYQVKFFQAQTKTLCTVYSLKMTELYVIQNPDICLVSRVTSDKTDFIPQTLVHVVDTLCGTVKVSRCLLVGLLTLATLTHMIYYQLELG